MTSFYKGLEAYILENDSLRLTFLPQYGCKLASLVAQKTGREFLFQSSLEKLSIPPYGAAFSDYDSSGFDEVFPSIDACPYPCGPWEGTKIPDHGEVWALPWEVTFTQGENRIQSVVRSSKFPYVLTRVATLQNNEVLFAYTVENTSDAEFEFIWTPHCLLACSPATRLLIPPELNQVMTVEHSTQHLGPWGTLHTYPLTNSVQGHKIDLSKTEPVSAHNCEKFYFTSPNTAGWCGIEHTDTHEQLIYTYSAQEVPYLGVWKTQGGYRGDYNIALEPCTGIYDDLYVAHKIRRAAKIAPRAKRAWNLKMTVR
ncbi:MAG: DUF5107 domain-containing protein [Elusimicrobiaceae bacterium]|nr:DUF5107 domain-containing protein [Elusimicrobiaceae bacterium]